MGEKASLKIGHLRITDHLILGIVKHKLDKGEISLSHSQIDTIAMTGWNDIGDALNSGEIDIAFMLAPFAMETFNLKQNIRLILFSHKSGSIIVTNKRANISKLEDFKGKTILIPYHLSVHHMIIDKLLTEKGLTTGVGKDVIFEVIAPSQIPEVIEWDKDGDIGGFIVAEPFGTQVVNAGMGNEFALSKDIWPNHPCCVIVARDEIIGKYTDALHELTQHLVQAGMFINDNTAEAAKIGAEFLNQKIDVMQKVLTQPADRVTTTELFPTHKDLDTMQTYLTTKISAMSNKIDLDKFIDTQFAKAAGAK